MEYDQCELWISTGDSNSDPNRCGGPGAGKSMRAKRMMALLCEGWIKGSGSSSAKAGMNGGMDYLCGRLVYYDGAAQSNWPYLHTFVTFWRATISLTRSFFCFFCRDYKRLWFQRLGAH